MEPIRPRPRLTAEQRAALRRMQDFRPITPESISQPTQPQPMQQKSRVVGDVMPTRRRAMPASPPQQPEAQEPYPDETMHMTEPTQPPRRRHSKRPVVFAVIAILVLAALGAGAWWFKGRNKTPGATQSVSQQSTTPQAQQAGATHLRLIASGDELPHSAISQAAKTSSGYDYTPFYDTIKPVFTRADVRFCNQETVSAGEEYGISGYPTFNVSKQFARDLNTVGCNLINVANNHINDKGQAGINETLSVWDEIKPLAIAGANRNADEQKKVRYFTQHGIKFAFVAYSEITNTTLPNAYSLNMLNDALVTQQLTEARSQADIVLVSVHWGTEYSEGINSAQDTWSNKFAALGADVVMGTGPHVLEPVKKLPRAGGGETLVWYSLGNMLSAQLDVPSLIGGFAVMDINLNTKKIDTIGFMPTYMHYEWTAEQKAKEDLLARHNFQIYALDKAADALKKSQNDTTVEAQAKRVTQLLNTYTSVPIMTVDQYLAR
jgi:poly-gamma-glutamate capsule biosynthesis protein CapA/YwtB (metallophosphatase superfamily)